MNVYTGEVKRKEIKPLRSTVYDGKVQHMVNSRGKPKGLRQVLQERGLDVSGLKREQLVAILSEHHDSKNEKFRLEKELERFRYRALFSTKFHPELNPIERVWGKAKVYTRTHCNYTFEGLERTITPAFDSVSLDSIRKYFRKMKDYIHAY